MKRGILTYKFDTHTHTTFSDGQNTESQILTYAAHQKCILFSITDHDHLALPASYRHIYLPGVEISTNLKGFNFHLLAYFPQLASFGAPSYVFQGQEIEFAPNPAKNEFLECEKFKNFQAMLTRLQQLRIERVRGLVPENELEIALKNSISISRNHFKKVSLPDFSGVEISEIKQILIDSECKLCFAHPWHSEGCNEIREYLKENFENYVGEEGREMFGSDFHGKGRVGRKVSGDVAVQIIMRLFGKKKEQSE